MSKKNSIVFSLNSKKIKKELAKRQSRLGNALNATARDFGKRAPGWISQEVRNIYGTNAGTVKEAFQYAKKSGTVKVSGVKGDRIQVNNMQLIYRGRLLTPVHFRMTPKVRPNKRYQVKATILKGERKSLASDAFLAGTGGESDGEESDGEESETQIAFRRAGAERLPIYPIKTVSVPQMITSDRTQDTINKRISKEMNKRLKHHIKRLNKKR